MTQLGGRQWSQVWTAVSSALVSAMPAEIRAEQHLAAEAIVAYVDGELSIAAHERATHHLAGCTQCTAEVAAQRQARAAVRNATDPAMPASLLAALYAIPQSVDLPPGPEELVVDQDGELMVAQRPRPDAPPLHLSAPLGSADRLGSGSRLGSAGALGSAAPLGAAAPAPSDAGRKRSTTARRAKQGAGVVVSGLVLGALAMVAPIESTVGGSAVTGEGPGGAPSASVVPARFELNTRPESNTISRPVTAPGRAQR